MRKDMICIICPMGCRLEIDVDENQTILSIQGNACPRGPIYAKKELTFPTRTLTSTVKIKGAIHQRCPVISSQEFDKKRLFDVMRALETIEIDAPVRINDVIIENVCGLGIDMIASRSMSRFEENE